MEQLIALSSSYKTPISFSPRLRLFFCRHYWIRYVSVLLSSFEELEGEIVFVIYTG